jgi:hypothetical protein
MQYEASVTKEERKNKYSFNENYCVENTLLFYLKYPYCQIKNDVTIKVMRDFF